MASTMPEATAWRARPWLVQWVMCSPSVIGSRQASATTWARCRGGNLLGAAQARAVQQRASPAGLLVAAAQPPDGGAGAPQACGDLLDRRAGGDGEEDAGMLDLMEGQPSALCDGLEDGQIGRSNVQRARLAATHGSASQSAG